MKTDQKGSALTVVLVVLVIILAAVAVYFALFKKSQTVYEQVPVPVMQQPQQAQSATVSNAQGSQQVQTTIYVPKNETTYYQMIDNGEAGTKPDTTSLTAADFTPKTVTVTTTSSYSIEHAAADAAAATVKSQTVIKTIGFKILNNTAYVVLNIDVDGWAGVSYSIDAVDPIITQTLLHFPDIKHVEIGTNEALQVTGVPRP